METDKNKIVKSIGDSSAVVVGGIRIVCARHDHAVTLALEFRSRRERKFQHDVLFENPVFAARSRVGGAMRGIQDDHRT